MSTPTDSPADQLSGRAWGVLLVLCGAVFLDALDVSMMGVALPSIRDDLGMSTNSLQWVVSAYVLGYGGFLLLGGRAADLFGRRRMFLGSLGVFLLFSGLGGLAQGGSLLIAARFVTGVAAAFTAPAGLSIITTTFAEGPARNRALSIYTGTGAIRLVPDSGRTAHASRGFDLPGAISLTSAMLLLVFTVVEAPEAGWASARTLGSIAGVAVLLAAFAAIERRTATPLVRLGILRSGSLVRANIGAMSLIGAWFGCQFITTLYAQQLRGWSALETGLAVFPAGLVVALLAGRVTPSLVGRFGVMRVIVVGLSAAVVGYALFLRIGLDSNYATMMLPTFVLTGTAFGLAYGSLNIAATNGIAAHEQGLAGGLVNTSFQFGGALVIAIVTAVDNANTGPGPQALLDGFQAALVVPFIVAVVGLAAVASGVRRRPASAVELSSGAVEAVEAA